MSTRSNSEKPGFRQSEALTRAGFRHAFFTRNGGVSEGPYRSLNFSIAVGDDSENVRKNLELAAGVLGVSAEHVYFLSQVHESSTVVVDGTEAREEVLLREGDAVLSANGKVACAVRVADCLPVLIADRASGIVAAAHAGWRGIVRGVIEAAVADIQRLTGKPLDLVAAIGPHISVEAFEVSPEVADELLRCSPDPDVVDHARGERPHVDLARIARAKLLELGLSPKDVDRVPGCTVRDADELFSYRRDGPRSGRHLAAIVPRAAARE